MVAKAVCETCNFISILQFSLELPPLHAPEMPGFTAVRVASCEVVGRYSRSRACHGFGSRKEIVGFD